MMEIAYLVPHGVPPIATLAAQCWEWVAREVWSRQEPLRRAAVDLVKERERLDKDFKKLTEEIKPLHGQISDWRQKYENAHRNESALNRLVNELQPKLKNTSTQLEEARQEVQQLTSKLATLQQQHQAALAQVQTAQDWMRMLEGCVQNVVAAAQKYLRRDAVTRVEAEALLEVLITAKADAVVETNPGETADHPAETEGRPDEATPGATKPATEPAALAS